MPWREGVGTPFNLQSSGPSEQTTDEFSSDVQNEAENAMAFVSELENQTLHDSPFDFSDSAVREAWNSEEWSRVDPSEQDADEQLADEARRLELRQHVNSFFSRHVARPSDEPCQSSEVFSTLIAHSIAVQTSASLPAMPWETGPMRSIFMRDNFEADRSFCSSAKLISFKRH